MWGNETATILSLRQVCIPTLSECLSQVFDHVLRWKRAGHHPRQKHVFMLGGLWKWDELIAGMRMNRLYEASTQGSWMRQVIGGKTMRLQAEILCRPLDLPAKTSVCQKKVVIHP